MIAKLLHRNSLAGNAVTNLALGTASDFKMQKKILCCKEVISALKMVIGMNWLCENK